MPAINARKDLWFALLVALLVTGFIGYGKLPLDIIGTGDSRAGQLAREMVQNGQYILPSLQGKISTQSVTKPPLYHWMLIATAGQLGWQNFSLRLVSVFSGLAGLLIAFRLARQMFDPGTGVIAAIVLSVSVLMVDYSLSGRMDLFFSVLLSASLWAFYVALVTDRTSFYITVGYVFMGLAVMTKGPVGLLIPQGTLALFLLFSGNRQRFAEFFSWKYWLLLFAIALPWYIYVVVHAPADVVHEMFLGEPENWLQHKSDVGPGSRLWFYFPILLIGLFPWSFFLLTAVIQAFSRVRKEHHGGLLFLLIWLLLGLVIFSIGGKKVPRYILPVLVPAAILIAWHWQQLFAQRHSKRLLYQGIGILIVLSGIGLGALGLWVASDPSVAASILSGDYNATETADRNVVWQALTGYSRLLFFSSAAMIVTSLLSWPLVSRKSPGLQVLGYSSIPWFLMLFYFNAVVPVMTKAESPRVAAEYIRSCTHEGQLIYGGGDAYHHAFLWYFNRPFEQLPNRMLEQAVREHRDIPVFIMHRHPLSADILANYPSRVWKDSLRTIHFFPTESCEGSGKPGSGDRQGGG